MQTIDEDLSRNLGRWHRIAHAAGLRLGGQALPQAIADQLRELQRGLTGERTRVATDYMDERGALRAYLLYYWTISLCETAAALAELRARRQLPEIRSVLDVGSGPGPAACAASLFGAERALLVDKSELALGAAKEIAAAGKQAGFSLEVSTERRDLEDFRPPEGSRFDLIVASRSINELWKDDPRKTERRRDFIRSILPALRDGGLLLLVEPSAHYTSIPLLELRESLRGEELNCAGPCPHLRACPMLAREGRPCFSEWEWHAPASIAELAEGAGLDRTSLKASWVAFIKGPQAAAMARPLLERDSGAAEGAAAGAAEDVVTIRGRVVSEPMLNKAGRVRYIICEEGGSLATISAPQRDERASRTGFFELRRGDLLEVDGLEARGEGHFGFGPAARLRVKMRAPRL